MLAALVYARAGLSVSSGQALRRRVSAQEARSTGAVLPLLYCKRLPRAWKNMNREHATVVARTFAGLDRCSLRKGAEEELGLRNDEKACGRSENAHTPSNLSTNRAISRRGKARQYDRGFE